MAEDHDLPDLSGSDSQSPAGPEPLLFSPGDRIDDFEILSEIGRGGMGVVYRAREHSLNRVVALKVLSPGIAGNRLIAMRFRREAVLAANLSHPNIVPVFHIDKSDPPRYFTMEHIEGRSVKDKVEKEGLLPPAEAVRIAVEVCEALQHAHERNIIHRDIKPSNILLQDREERARVTDFGIAQDVTGTLAEVTHAEGSTSGTPAFMSPEQNLGHHIDNRSDIFSLGMTLYYMLTGRTAFSAKNRQQLALAFEKQTPVPPSRINHNVSPALDRVVLRIIASDPAKRFQSCREVAGALRDAVKAPTPAAPTETGEAVVEAKLADDAGGIEPKIREAARAFLKGLGKPLDQKSREDFAVRLRKALGPNAACDERTVRRVLDEEARRFGPKPGAKLAGPAGLLPYDEWEKENWGAYASFIHILLSLGVFCFGLALIIVTLTGSIVGIIVCLPLFGGCAYLGWQRFHQFVAYYNQYKLESIQLCLKAGDFAKGSEYALTIGLRGLNAPEALAAVKQLADLAEQHGDPRRAARLRARMDKLQGITPTPAPDDTSKPQA